MQATFTFTTPDTIGFDWDSAFRVGLYDTLGRAKLNRDLSASSKQPNVLYDGLPGYMIDFDVNLNDAASADINVRKHKDDTQGRLLGTTKGYDNLAAGGDAYKIEANTTYTAVLKLTKLAEGVEIAATLRSGDQDLSHFSTLDAGGDADTFGMLAFHVNSKTFGTSKSRTRQTMVSILPTSVLRFLPTKQHRKALETGPSFYVCGDPAELVQTGHRRKQPQSSGQLLRTSGEVRFW